MAHRPTSGTDNNIRNGQREPAVSEIREQTVSVGDPQGHPVEDARMPTEKVLSPSPAARKEHHA